MTNASFYSKALSPYCPFCSLSPIQVGVVDLMSATVCSGNGLLYCAGCTYLVTRLGHEASVPIDAFKSPHQPKTFELFVNISF